MIEIIVVWAAISVVTGLVVGRILRNAREHDEALQRLLEQRGNHPPAGPASGAAVRHAPQSLEKCTKH